MAPARSGLFITGTDTGVGKTVVAALFTMGWRARYWKPIQTGSISDQAAVARITALPPARFAAGRYHLPRPLSPHQAASGAGVVIERRRLAPPGGARPLIVEGAGGLLVPLNDTDTMIDLMGWLGLPVVLVARTRLGTINHTLLSLEALRRRRLPVAGVVLHGSARPAVAATIRERGRVPVVELPWLPALDPPRLQHAWRTFLAPHFSPAASATGRMGSSSQVEDRATPPGGSPAHNGARGASAALSGPRRTGRTPRRLPPRSPARRFSREATHAD